MPRSNRNGKPRLKWPTRRDLEAWWIWHCLKTAPMCDLDDPEAIRGWIIELDRNDHYDVHAILYQSYREFALEFAAPYEIGRQYA